MDSSPAACTGTICKTTRLVSCCHDCIGPYGRGLVMGPVQLFASGIVDGGFPGKACLCSNNHVYHPLRGELVSMIYIGLLHSCPMCHACGNQNPRSNIHRRTSLCISLCIPYLSARYHICSLACILRLNGNPIQSTGSSSLSINIHSFISLGQDEFGG
jgi:hypothetical protein